MDLQSVISNFWLYFWWSQYTKKSAEYYCDGKFKPGFYEQAEYFINQLNLNKVNAKHSSLKECLLTTQLIENLREINYA